MDKLEIFNFNGRDVRVFINEKNEPEFCASDITDILGYSNGRDSIDKLCKTPGVSKRDIGVKTGTKKDGTPATQIVKATFISEGNLYRLILKSNKPEAEPFEQWVCDEVLPTIRKHGAYMTDVTLDKVIADPDMMIGLLTELKKERAAKEQLQVTAELQQKQLKQAAPKVEYYEAVLQSEKLILTNVIAKELGMSAVTLNKKLHEKGIIYHSGNTWVLYNKYEKKGYAGTKTHTYTNSQGAVCTSIHLYWTEKGREFIHSLFKENITFAEGKHNSN